jgi:hypothetical protein
MLYTSRPLERIYADPTTFESKKRKQKEQGEQAEYSEVPLQNGRIVTRRDGENYVIEKVNSTDMKDYLNEQYVPGKNIK